MVGCLLTKSLFCYPASCWCQHLNLKISNLLGLPMASGVFKKIFLCALFLCVFNEGRAETACYSGGWNFSSYPASENWRPVRVSGLCNGELGAEMRRTSSSMCLLNAPYPTQVPHNSYVSAVSDGYNQACYTVNGVVQAPQATLKLISGDEFGYCARSDVGQYIPPGFLEIRNTEEDGACKGLNSGFSKQKITVKRITADNTTSALVCSLSDGFELPYGMGVFRYINYESTSLSNCVSIQGAYAAEIKVFKSGDTYCKTDGSHIPEGWA